MRRLIACLQALQVTFRASGESPEVNPALVIRNWGLSPARVEIDGQPVPAGKDLRIGSVHRLEGDDLVVWIRKEATAPLIETCSFTQDTYIAAFDSYA